MNMLNKDLNGNINLIINLIGPSNTANIKNFFIGKDEKIDAVIIYIDSLVDKDSISKDILMPLMLHVNEDFIKKKNPCEYIAKGYITVINHKIERDLNKISDAIKSGYTVVLIEGINEAVVADTKGGQFRTISEPPNETTIKGNHEGFVENLETNISLLRRNIKDSNFTIEYFKVGSRSQTDVGIVYISDIADKDIIAEVRTRLNAVDVDYLTDGGALSQYIEDSPY
jgi:spore germination protein KA